MALRITFVLPGKRPAPVGGFKVVYEYANRLAERGFQVTIVHAANPDKHASLKQRFRRLLTYLRSCRNGRYEAKKWFSFRPGVELTWVPSLQEKYIPHADFVVATAWRTAEWVSGYSGKCGGKFYLVQGYEDWDGPADRVAATWKLPLTKIVISRWLLDMAASLGEKAVYVPNGLAQEEFYEEVPQKARPPASVLMLHHLSPWKGSADGVRSLEIVKKSMPDLKATLFGVPERPQDLPEWVRYVHRPSGATLRALYNEHAIFLAPSSKEGWGLTPAESMLCGCAVVAADNGGHREFAVHGETAMISEPGDATKFAENIALLIADNDQRIRLAEEGKRYVQQYTWDRALDNFTATIRNSADTSR